MSAARRLREMAGGCCAALLLAACTTETPPVAPPERIAREAAGGVPVFVVYNHFHTGLTVPTAAILARPGPTARALAWLKPQPWTSLGYGDEKFYEQRGINPARIVDFFRFMLGPDNPSVAHLEGVDDPQVDPSLPRLLRLTIPPARFDDFMRRVDQTFALKDGQPQFLTRGQDANDDFFRARAPASVLHECNQWAGAVLGAAGIPHDPVLDTTSDGLAFDLKSSGQAVPAAVRP